MCAWLILNFGELRGLPTNLSERVIRRCRSWTPHFSAIIFVSPFAFVRGVCLPRSFFVICWKSSAIPPRDQLVPFKSTALGDKCLCGVQDCGILTSLSASVAQIQVPKLYPCTCAGKTILGSFQPFWSVWLLNTSTFSSARHSVMEFSIEVYLWRLHWRRDLITKVEIHDSWTHVYT